jgi:hypothetical protein
MASLLNPKLLHLLMTAARKTGMKKLLMKLLN